MFLTSRPRERGKACSRRSQKEEQKTNTQNQKDGDRAKNNNETKHKNSRKEIRRT
jgi:hypothetical protein